MIDVPVAPGSPQAGSATPVPAPGPGWGAPGVAPAVPARPVLPPAPRILPPDRRVIVPGPWNTQRRSLADMANEQLRRGKPKDPLAEGMEGAAREDCLRPSERESSVGGLLNAPSVIGRALSGNCPK
ncbi:MAG TPA: hypothetical protein VGD76_08815 [Ramlibacter sp.]